MVLTSMLRRPAAGRAFARIISGRIGGVDPLRQPCESRVASRPRRPAAPTIVGRVVVDRPLDRSGRASSSSSSSSGGKDDGAAAAAAAEAAASDEKNGADEGAAVDDREEAAGCDPSSPGSHFPWRHDPSPPARIVEMDDYSGMPNNFQSRLIRRVVACKELNMTAWDAVPLPFGFTHQWEEELADNFGVAFRMALGELLESAFGDAVEVKNDEIDGISISVDSSVVKSDEVADEGAAKNLFENEYLRRMFDRKLLREYATLDPAAYHLKLSIRPTDARLQHIFAVPMITREIVEKKPHLKGGYQRIEKEFAETRSYNTVKKMTYELADDIGEEDAYNRTVIADAVITCSEFYQLKDPSTGLVVRGMEDGAEDEEVVHNVRFEVTTERDEDGTRRMAGSWKIVDLDDLLEGNVFY